MPLHHCLLFPGFDPRQTMMTVRMLMIMMPITIIFNTSEQITQFFLTSDDDDDDEESG